jgi:hypothetical protein
MWKTKGFIEPDLRLWKLDIYIDLTVNDFDSRVIFVSVTTISMSEFADQSHESQAEPRYSSENAAWLPPYH